MEALNLAVVEIKAFVPAWDFEVSKAFYQAIRFTLASSAQGIAYFHCGNASFLLQDFHVRAHADNFQMHLLVESVDDWHQRIEAERIAERFNVKVGTPEDRPWGMRDFTLFDPSGILWRVAQNIPVPAKA